MNKPRLKKVGKKSARALLRVINLTIVSRMHRGGWMLLSCALTAGGCDLLIGYPPRVGEQPPSSSAAQEARGKFVMKGFFLGMPLSDARVVAENLFASKRPGSDETVRDFYAATMKVTEAIDRVSYPRVYSEYQNSTNSTVLPISTFSIGSSKPLSSTSGYRRSPPSTTQKLIFPAHENRSNGADGYTPFFIGANDKGAVNYIEFHPEFVKSVFGTQGLQPHEFAREFFAGYGLPVEVEDETAEGWRFVSKDGYAVEVTRNWEIIVHEAATSAARGFD